MNLIEVMCIECTRLFKGADITKKQGLIKSSIILMISVFVGKAAGLIFKISLANLLGGTGMGYFSSAYAVFTPLYALCAASLTPAVAQLVSENEAMGSIGRVRGAKLAAIKIFLLPSIICSVVPMVSAGFITERIIANEGAKLAVIAISPCVFLGTITAIYRGYYEGLRNMTPTAASQVVESVVRVVSGLGFAYGTNVYAFSQFVNGHNVFGVHCVSETQFSEVSLPYVAAAAILGVTVSEVSSFTFMLIRHRFGDGYPRDIRPNTGDIKLEEKRLLALILPITGAAIVSSLAGTVDLYTIIVCLKTAFAKNPWLYSEKYADIIASGVRLKDLPNYLYGSFTGLAATVFSLAPSICSVFGKSALPNVAEAWARNDLQKTRREIRRVLCAIMYISVPAGLGLSMLSKEILGLLFSSRVEEVAISSTPLSILALGTAIVTVEGAAFSMLQAVGKADLPIKINLLGAFVKLGLNTILVPIPSLGLSGAAIASVLSSIATCTWSVGALYKTTGAKPKLLYSLSVPLSGSIVACFAAGKALKAASNSLSNALSVAIAVSFAVISYIIFILLLDISTKNRLRNEILGK